MYETLSNYALQNIKGGEPVTLTAIMAVLVIAIITVVVYKLFTSKSGSTQIPGGFKFEWR
ncbi:MAG: hypothetical protein WC275_04150 [Bacilli bacterium]|jgi:hypothetical protein